MNASGQHLQSIGHAPVDDSVDAVDNFRPGGGIKTQFEHLISARAIIPHFHPVVSLANRTVVGFELLARSTVPRLQTPAQMFSAA